MKNLLLLLTAILFAFSSVAQGKKSGGLDDDKAKIDAEAKVNVGAWKAKVGGKYDLDKKKIDKLEVEFGMTAGDIVIAAEISKKSGKSIEEVSKVYKDNKGNGWGNIAKQMGIKPGSAEFHALKNGVSEYSMNDNGKSKKKSPGYSKGKSRGNSKGKSKKAKKNK